MKYRCILCIALLLCISATALADTGGYSGSLPEEMFDAAKYCLCYMSYGMYQDALTLLGFSSPTAEEFKLFAEASFPTLSDGVQTDVAVACLTDEYGWIIAIPLWKPDAMDVDTFLLHSSDGATFDGYTSATWEFVSTLLTQSKETIWHDRYEPSSKFVVAD